MLPPHQSYIRSYRYRRHCPVPKTTYTNFMAEGFMHFRKGYYRRALHCFNRAMDMKPGDRSCQLARSYCYLKLGDAPSALKDIELSFEKDKGFNYVKGLLHYAECLYSLGMFEKASIAFWKGHRLRKYSTEFRVGIIKCENAIKNATMGRDATQIEDSITLFPQLKAIERLEGRKDEHCCILESATTKFTQSELEIIEMQNNKSQKYLDGWIDNEILGLLKEDKKFLRKLLRRPDFHGEQGITKLLRNEATEALNYLQIRESFLRWYNPIYARKYGLNFNDEVANKYEEEERLRLEACLKIKSDAAADAIDKHLISIRNSLKIGRFIDCQMECSRTLKQLSGITTRILPNKIEYVVEVLHYKGIAYYKQKLYGDSISVFYHEFQVAGKYKMSDAKSRALDLLAKSHALKGNYNEATEYWDLRLPLLKHHIDKVYTMNEIGKCHLELKRAEMAKMYGQLALAEAMIMNEPSWIMKAHVLLAQCFIKTHKLDMALFHYSKAEEYAKQTPDVKESTISLLEDAQGCMRLWIIRKREESEIRISELKMQSTTTSDTELINTTIEDDDDEEEEDLYEEHLEEKIVKV